MKYFLILGLVSFVMAQIQVDMTKGTIITQIPPKDIQKIKAKLP